MAVQRPDTRALGWDIQAVKQAQMQARAQATVKPMIGIDRK